MKKIAAWILVALMALSCAVTALAESDSSGTDAAENSEWLYAEDEQDDADWVEATDEDVLEAEEDELETNEDEDFFLSALEVYGWFEAQPLDVDPDFPSEDNTKYLVLDERLNTMEALEAEVRTYFSDAIANKLLDSGIYTEYDGHIYTNAEDRQVDSSVGETELNVVDRTDKKITYSLTVNYLDTEGEVTRTEELSYVRELIDGQWKFTEFPYFL